MSLASHPSRTKILDAAMTLIRAQGYSATTIDGLCAAAGLTKGGFFHHFRDKEDLAVAAAGHFAQMAERLFAGAPYRSLPDPLMRLFGYVDFRTALLKGSLPQFTCLLGTLVQEAYQTHPAIRQACERHIDAHAAEMAKDIALAKDYYMPDAEWNAEGLALHIQAVIQGSFVLAKARNGPAAAIECLGHLRRYLELLFHYPKPEEETHGN